MTTNSIKSISCMILSALWTVSPLALASEDFGLAKSTTVVYSGTSGSTLDSCDVTIRTDADGMIAYLAMTGAFSGRALSTPSTLRPAPGGYEGVVEFFKGIPVSDIVYEKHIFRAGLTLSWMTGPVPTHMKEAQLFGKDLTSLRSFSYSEQGPFLRLKGECRDLSLRSSEQ